MIITGKHFYAKSIEEVFKEGKSPLGDYFFTVSIIPSMWLLNSLWGILLSYILAYFVNLFTMKD